MMDELHSRHRKEQRDLQSRITQKKKAATKKTRKSVNDVCYSLEQQLRERQEKELAAVNGKSPENEVHDTLVDVSQQKELQPNRSNEVSELADSLLPLSVSLEQPSTTMNSGEPHRKPNRQKARLARRAAEQEAIAAQAAEEALSIPDLKQRERARMLEECEKRGLQEKEVAANGHCLYLAMADQMTQLDKGPASETDLNMSPSARMSQTGTRDYRAMRKAAADYIAANPDDFIPFLEEPLEGYVRKVSDTGEWGGQLELLALAKTYKLEINVLQGDGRVEKIEGGSYDALRATWLAYYKHGFGLGEHYNSLRKIKT